MPDKYTGRVFSHFEGSNEKFYYCDSFDGVVAVMTNTADHTIRRTVPLADMQRSYIDITGDLARKLGITDEAFARYFQTKERV